MMLRIMNIFNPNLLFSLRTGIAHEGALCDQFKAEVA